MSVYLQKKIKVDWKRLHGAFPKPRRLHLVAEADGLEHCPVTSCQHPVFTSRRGCCKHVKTKHGWYYYFDNKPDISDKLIPHETQKNCCSADNGFAPSFGQWVQSSCGGGKSRKQSNSTA